MPVGVAARWMRAVALAVQKAHEAGVIHRDLKPSNVMLTMDDEPIVMDFGLARRSKSGETELTATGLMLGSPSYMSPEQVEARHQEVGPWTDVWALASCSSKCSDGHRRSKAPQPLLCWVESSRVSRNGFRNCNARQRRPWKRFA